MAEGKNSFLLYKDLIHTISMLTDIQRGQLILIIFEYVNDLNPVVNDPVLKIVFEPIKQQLKRDLRKYEVKKKYCSDAGKASAKAKKNKRQQKLTGVNERQQQSTDSTVSVSVSVSVSVIKDILSFLNKKTGKSFKNTTQKTHELIQARFNEGFTKEDFFKVIEKKTNDWLNNEKMKDYLQPTTLFSNKFEGYLNSASEIKLTTKKHPSYSDMLKKDWKYE